MNSYLYDDGSDADCQQSCQLHTDVTEEFWNEMSDIRVIVKNLDFS